MCKKLLMSFLLVTVTSHVLSLSTLKTVVKNDEPEARLPRGVIRVRRTSSSLSNSDYHGNDIDEDSLPVVDNEQPRNARPYKHPGHWATPAPESGIDLGFTPVQTYLQVRRTNSVQHLPQSEAIKEATSEDEVLNAHRLREVLRTKKIQEVYSEEGYEDSAYDHGNHERHAEHDEGFAKHKAGKYKVTDPVQHLYDVADAESQVVEKKNKPKKKIPRVSRERMETSSMKVAYMGDEPGRKRWGQASSGRHVRSQSLKHKRAPKVVNKAVEEKTFVQPVKRDFVSQRDDFWTFPSSFDEISINKWGANFEPKNPKNKVKETKEKVTTGARVRIPPVPTFGYIHSLTNAYYGSQAPMVHHHPKPIPSHVINLTETFQPSQTSYPGFKAKRFGARFKRDDEESEGAKETEEYEKELTKNLDEQEKSIVGSALKNLGVQKDLSEKYHFLTPPPPAQKSKYKSPRTFLSFDEEKYPYYNLRGINPYSPLRYASHPREFPRKSGEGMEFYSSRDRAMHCEPISVSLDDAPKEQSTWDLTEQPGSKKRIVRLGDKIKCLKIKYFGEDPLDSPFFKEDDLKSRGTKKARSDDGLKFHSSYQYQPNKTLNIFTKEKWNDSEVEGTQDEVKYQTLPQSVVQLVNGTEEYREIPVEEHYSEMTTTSPYIELTTAAPIMGMRPPPVRYSPFPLSVIRIPRRPKPLKLMTRIKYKYNCLQPVTRMTISERSDGSAEDIMFDCLDVMLIQTMRDGNPHFQIIPKIKTTRRSDMSNVLLDESVNFGAGEVRDNSLLARRKRSTPMARRKSQLFPNKSLLDKLVKKSEKRQNGTINMSLLDLGEKSPDEVSAVLPTRKLDVTKTSLTTTTTSTTTTTTTPSTTTTQGAVKFEPKPLQRLSGRDFLVRYHKSKGSKKTKQTQKEEFWKVEASTVRPSSARVSLEQMESPVNSQDSNQRLEKLGNEETEFRPFRPKMTKSTQLTQSPKIEDRSYKKATDEVKVEERSWKTKRDEPGPTPAPVLLYIVDQSTGQGQWITEYSTTTELSVSSEKKGSGRQLKKQNARKVFFTKKLKKVL